MRMLDLVVILGVLIALVSTASLGVSFMFAAALRTAHPGIWRAHASPRWASGRNTPWSLLRFMRSPAYKNAQSPRVRALGRQLHFLSRVLLGTEAALLIALAVFLLSR